MPESLVTEEMVDASWIIVDTTTGKAVFETYDFELCQFINIIRYAVVPVRYYLAGLSKNHA